MCNLQTIEIILQSCKLVIANKNKGKKKIIIILFFLISSMDSKTSLCVICDLRHLTSPSTHWCEDCEEALCTNCKGPTTCRKHPDAMRSSLYPSTTIYLLTLSILICIAPTIMKSTYSTVSSMNVRLVTSVLRNMETAVN